MKQTKGITMIALMVTIVVLVILAGVSIAVLRDDDSLVNRALDVKNDNRKSSIKEIVDMWEIHREGSLDDKGLESPNQ